MWLKICARDQVEFGCCNHQPIGAISWRIVVLVTPGVCGSNSISMPSSVIRSSPHIISHIGSSQSSPWKTTSHAVLPAILRRSVKISALSQSPVALSPEAAQAENWRGGGPCKPTHSHPYGRQRRVGHKQLRHGAALHVSLMAKIKHPESEPDPLVRLSKTEPVENTSHYVWLADWLFLLVWRSMLKNYEGTPQTGVAAGSCAGGYAFCWRGCCFLLPGLNQGGHLNVS